MSDSYQINELIIIFIPRYSKKVAFFTNGYFDFENQNWKSSREIIETSQWFVPKWAPPHFKTYPQMNDRLAYVKEWFQKATLLIIRMCDC